MSADNLLYEESLASEFSPSDFVKRTYTYIADQNNGSYSSGQVTIDTSSLANSGQYQSFKEGFLLIPIITEMKVTDGTITNNQANSTWAFKSGAWNIIHSLSVQYCNQTVIQEIPLINLLKSFEALTTWSQNDLLNDGPGAMFYPDNMSSWSYCTASATDTAQSASGVGLANNRDTPVTVAIPIGTASTVSALATNKAGAPTSTTGVYSTGINANNVINVFNDGFAKRQEWINYSPGQDAGNYSLNQGAINGTAACSTNLRSYYAGVSTVGTVTLATWATYLKIRLKDLSSFFNEMPLQKGGYLRFIINTNQATVAFANTPAVINAATGVPTAYPALACTSSSVSPGSTCPIILSSAASGQGGSTLSGTYEVSVSIAKGAYSGNSYGLNNCRLYIPSYTMQPALEKSYLSLTPMKKVVYRDATAIQTGTVQASSTFSTLVTNGVPNLRGVLVVPLLATNPGAVSSTLLSPFSTTGGTPDPIMVHNFQVQVSGVNLFQNNLMYDYEVFLEELRKSGQLNADLTTGLTSGLISEDSFSRGMRWYYADCSRLLESELTASRSVQISGTNVSLVACYFYVFLIQEKTITVRTIDGSIVTQ